MRKSGNFDSDTEVDRPRNGLGLQREVNNRLSLQCVGCRLVWVEGACLTPFNWGFGEEMTLKLNWKFSKKIRIETRRWDRDSRFEAKFGENRPLASCQKVIWFWWLKRPPPPRQTSELSPIFPQIILHTDSENGGRLQMCTKFGPDRLRFAAVRTIPERLIFRSSEVIAI